MDGAKLDRLARAIAETLTRRQAVLWLSAATSLLGQETARGFQLGPATCREEGAACTLLSGCCDGLTCVTSAINTTYGVCVPGDGGMVSTGTTLISPFSETAVEEVGALMETDPTTPAPDSEADPHARAAESRARKKSRRTDRKTRMDTRRGRVQTRRDERQSQQGDDHAAPEEALIPQLQLKLLFHDFDLPGGVGEESLIPIEVVRVTNRDDVDVVLTRIETIKGPPIEANLPASKFTLGRGASYAFVSGLPSDDIANATKDRYQWLDTVICDEATQKQGYRLTAAFSPGGETYDFVVYCHGRRVTGAVKRAAAAPPRGRNKTDAQKHKRNSRHEMKKKR